MTVAVPLPPVAQRDMSRLRYGDRVPVASGAGEATVIADMDFETYSEAGFVYHEDLGKWKTSRYSTKKGLGAIGVQVYAEHPSTEVLCLAYDLKDGEGKRLWLPNMPPPQDLFNHLARGGWVEAHNAAFEERIWNVVCAQRYGWPELPAGQLRCSQHKARSFCLPASLEAGGNALNITNKKDTAGAALLRRFAIPRDKTKHDQRTRIHPLGDPKGVDLYRYCLQDIDAEFELSMSVPDVSELEQKYWLMDFECNRDGCRMDAEAIDAAIEYLDYEYERAVEEIQSMSSGTITKPTQNARIIQFLVSRGVNTKSVDEEHTEMLLADPNVPEDCKRLLKIRKGVASASVRKFFTMKARLSSAGRIHEMFIANAARTGRDAGRHVQPQNLPNSGPDVKHCSECGSYFGLARSACPECGTDASLSPTEEWGHEAAEFAIARLVDRTIQYYFDDVIEALIGCIRAFFIADEGGRFIGSDYSSIEAVVAAILAGEQWRIETFRRRDCIYLASASKITGTPVSEYLEYKRVNGQHHPDRKLGKVAELASGYGGWIGSWLNFGADSFIEGEDNIKEKIKAWRDASPAIVEAWGGQMRGMWENKRPELYGLEGCFIQAYYNPNTKIHWREGVYYIRRGEHVQCVLPSGRAITYHNVFLTPSTRPYRDGEVTINFWGWNSDSTKGKLGWVQLDTYGGRLFENVVQAVARDIMAYAAVNLHNSGYPIRLRVHDELVASVPYGQGGIEEFERIGDTMPPWAEGWPIRMSGGWEGKRFRK